MTGTSSALLIESPLANKVTSWPRSISSSVSHETTRSVPPYSFGGTLSASGATCAIRNAQTSEQISTDSLPRGGRWNWFARCVSYNFNVKAVDRFPIRKIFDAVLFVDSASLKSDIAATATAMRRVLGLDLERRQEISA